MNQSAAARPGISLSEILTDSWKIFTEHFRAILIIILIVQVPLQIAFWGINRVPILSGQQDFLAQQENLISNNKSDQVDRAGFVQAVAELSVASLAVHFFGSLITTLSVMAIVLVVKAAREGGRIDYREALRPALARWPAAILTLLMIQVMLSVLFVFLVVPMIVFYVYWTFAIQAVIIHGRSGWGAARYSMDLVKNRWWKVLGFSLVFGIMSQVIATVINAINVERGAFPADIAFAVVTSIALSYFVVAYALFFFDLDASRQPAAATGGLPAGAQPGGSEDDEASRQGE